MIRVCVRGVSPTSEIEYVGRQCAGWKGSPLGNPYKAGVHGTLPEVIAKYRVWLFRAMYKPTWEGAWVMTELERLARMDNPKIGCWCAVDAQCHSDVVISAIEYLRRNNG